MIQDSVNSAMLISTTAFVFLCGLRVTCGYRMCTDLSNLHSKATDSPVIVHAQVAELFGTIAEVIPMKIYKGQEIINKLPKVMNMQGKPLIFINGVNSISDVCPNNVRRHQEKLWLAEKGNIPRELKLKHGVVDLTGEVKTVIEDVLRGKIPKGPIALPMQSDDPCRHTNCKYGAECHLDAHSRKAICICPKSCPITGISARVCGTDGVTYANECELRRSACLHMSIIEIQHAGSCGQKVNPCKWKLCYLGGRCISVDGIKAECECSKACEYQQASRRRELLCGSNMKQYYSICQIKEEACRSQRYIGVKFRGRCPPSPQPQRDVPQESQIYEYKVENLPCQKLKCPSNSKCIVKKGKGSCVCQKICPVLYRPVCGSDGITYPNKCQLKRNSCVRNRNTTVSYNAPCSACKFISCKFHSRCELDKETRRPSCRCIPEKECPTSGDNPVCGSDSVTYMSLCHMKISACRQMKQITAVKKGNCPEENLCRSILCAFNATCIQTNNDRASCSCSHLTCQKEPKNPVCGSDGKTYINECSLYRARCEKQEDLKIVWSGPCTSERNPCLGHKCLHPHHVCRVDRDMRPTCLCPEQCPPVFKPVCGSDLVTYDNECELKRKTCIQKKDVKINYEGPCSNINLCLKKHPECKIHEICRLSSNQNPICECPSCPAKSSAMGNRVCGSDGKTYQHACELYSKACREKSSVVVKNDGPCDLCKNKICKNYAICKMDHYGRADCVCPSTCIYVNNPVCGSNGVTYVDECFLRVESCQSQKLIEVVAQGPCKPCPNNCPLGSMCLNGRCVCRKKCSSMPMEVCGTDGVYYRNECEMKRIGCLRKVNIEIDMDGNACRGRNSVPQIPSCQCNEIGSLSPMCDPLTNLCRCKPGVVGLRCDRCNTSYWGLRTNQGCKPCACDRRGSSRYDCDQMTGQCVCKIGVRGQRCDRCQVNKKLTNDGCKDISVVACQKIKCAHGAVCKFIDNSARCVCDIRCEENKGGSVCGQDGQTYQSECALKKENCKRQKTVLTDYAGRCKRGRIRAHDAVVRQPVYEERNPKRKIGDFCLNHKQCSASIAGSRCAYGQCECPPGQTASPDRKSCIESFRLLSADEKSIAKDTGINFGRDSFMKFPPIMKFGRHIGLNITLAPSNANGLIFYNGPTARHMGDYISLSLHDGYVIYRFNLGSGVLELRNRKKLFVAGEQTHNIYIERRGRKGTLIVDSEKSVVGRSPGRLRSLDLKNPLVIGNMNNAMRLSKMNIRPTFRSFKGCLLSFIVFNKRTNKQFNFLQELEPLQKYGTKEACIPKRPDPCFSNPCLNGGSCSINFEGKFSCRCSTGTFGARCEKNMKTVKLTVKTAEFNGKTLIKIPTTKYTIRKRIDLEIWFLSTASNGLIALLSDEDGEHFLSVMMMKGRLQVIIRNNNGISMIQSGVTVKLNEWNKVGIKKGRKFISLIVNGSRRSRARIVPRFFKSLAKEKRKMYVHFNVRGQPLFLGGYPTDILSSASIGSDVRFRGAIQKVILNGKRINIFLDPGIKRFNVSEWKGAPCGPSHSVCGQGTVCEPRLNSAYCRCVNPPCEHAMQDNPNPDGADGPINFDGKTLLKMKNMIKTKVTKMRRNNIRLVLKTESKNGLILLMTKSRKSTVKKDFFLLALRNGYPELAVNLGRRNGLIRISSKVSISDSNWHTIHALRTGNLVTMLVDGNRQTGYIRTDRRYPRKDTLTTDGSLWIGHSYRPVEGFPWFYRVGFTGCIERLYISEEPVTFSKHVRVKRGRLAPCTTPFEY